MAGFIKENTLFLREYVRHFHHTGAVLPSGRFLAAALTRFVREHGNGSRNILEVGPGTGAVTRRIVGGMNGGDRLDMVELNDSFVARLQERFQTEPSLQDRGRPCSDSPLPDRGDAGR